MGATRRAHRLLPRQTTPPHDSGKANEDNMGNRRETSVGVRVPRLLAVAAGGLALSCSQAQSGVTAKPAPYSTQNTDTVVIYPTEQNYTYTLGNGVDT